MLIPICILEQPAECNGKQSCNSGKISLCKYDDGVVCPYRKLYKAELDDSLELALKESGGNKIRAIKRYRELTGASLYYSRDVIDASWPNVREE
jgi:hypothetical protein